jgi:hypothetical protein
MPGTVGPGRETATQRVVGHGRIRSMPTTLLIATSPRSTWITSSDAATAKAVNALLGGRGHEVRRGGVLDPLATDIGIGVDALEAGEVLMAAGYEFRWHADQHPLDRALAAWGIPVGE